MPLRYTANVFTEQIDTIAPPNCRYYSIATESHVMLSKFDGRTTLVQLRQEAAICTTVQKIGKHCKLKQKIM